MTRGQALAALKAQPGAPFPRPSNNDDHTIEMTGFEALFDNGFARAIVSDHIERGGKELGRQSPPLIQEPGTPGRSATVNLNWDRPEVVPRADLEDQTPAATVRDANAFVLGTPTN